MGNIFNRGPTDDPDSAWQEQNKEIERNPIYKFAALNKEGRLVDAYRKGGVVAVQEIARREIGPYLYNGGKGAMVTRLDYIKWRKSKSPSDSHSSAADTKSGKDLLDEWNVHEANSFNKVTDHEACWDLSKRGGVGETPLHLLYLMDSAEHVETAKILLNMYPKLALDFYEADEYYGESCLHLATVYGDFESVKLLVSNGAFINQRATGRFFLPEDQKNGRTKTTNYEGYAYYGEYPLAFSVCFGYMDIYDYLIDNGADPNLQDSFGNTALHMAVISDQVEMYKYMVKHHKKPSKIDIPNNAKLTPLTLASKLGRHKLFKEILELNSIVLWRYSNVTCSTYPLTEIDSIKPNGEANTSSALMIVIDGEESDHLEMLEGGVMRQLLDDKWKTFARRRFFERLILAFIHLSFISVAVYLRPASGLLEYNEPKDAVRFLSEIIVCMSCVGYLILEVIEIGAQGTLAFLRNCSHAPAHTVFMISCLLILGCIPFRILNLQFVEDILMIIAVPSAWFFLLFFARSVKVTGPFVTMIYKMCVGDLIRFGIIYMIFLFGFTQGFFFLFRDINQESFNTFPNTIMTLFQMTLGEFKYHDFDLTRYALLTKLVFAVFMILVPILLLNMLIAMMGNTYQSVISKSEKEWRKQWAKIVVVLERGFTKKSLQKFYKEYSVKLAGATEEEDVRALVVIKTSPKTKARQRKLAVGNWKKLGREIINQLKQQKKKGKTGPLRLQKITRKQSILTKPKEDGSDSDDDKKFTNITAQLAWEKDIDLTKGQAFTNDPTLIENSTPRTVRQVSVGNHIGGAQTPDRQNTQMENGHAAQVPNGAPSTRPIKKYVKKPNGTPKSSPKMQKQFSNNRISPLPISKQVCDDDEFEITDDGSVLLRTKSQSQFSVINETQSVKTSSSEIFMIDSSKQTPVKEKKTVASVMKTDDGYVSHASHDTSCQEGDAVPRVGSADSKSMYEQWVNELIEGTPKPSPSRTLSSLSTSEPSTPSRRHKEKKRKKERKEKEKDRSRSREKKDSGKKEKTEKSGENLQTEQSQTANIDNTSPSSEQSLLPEPKV